MAFPFGKKEEKKPTTLEEVRKAYEDLSDEDKQTFHQSIADRMHESVAAQEREHGQEDSQSAEAREHEALGEEHADGEGDVAELHESDDTAEEQREDAADEAREETPAEDHVDATQDATQIEEAIKPLREEIAKLSARIDLMERSPQEVDGGMAKKLNELESMYNN